MHPIAFHFGYFTVHWYGIMVAVAFIAGLWTASRRAAREGINPEKIVDLGPWLIAGSFLGARIVYVVTYWNDEFTGGSVWEIFKVWKGGLVFYGGLIGAVLAVIIYVNLKGLPVWKTGDALTPSIPLGYFFGRIGCLMTGCCFGKPCSLAWAIRFPNQSPAWDRQHHEGLVGQFDSSLPVHPTQIYDSLLNLVLYLGLAWLYRRKKFDGEVFGVYLVCYALTRSFVESFRGDYPADHIHAGLTSAQVLSIVIVLSGVVVLWWRWKAGQTRASSRAS